MKYVRKESIQMIDYSERKNIGNHHFINADYIKKVKNFAKSKGYNGNIPFYQSQTNEKYIYCWQSGEKVYIGQSFSPFKRIYDEIELAFKKKFNLANYEKWLIKFEKEYVISNIKIWILEKVEKDSNIFEREEYWIKRAVRKLGDKVLNIQFN